MENHAPLNHPPVVTCQTVNSLTACLLSYVPLLYFFFDFFVLSLSSETNLALEATEALDINHFKRDQSFSVNGIIQKLAADLLEVKIFVLNKLNLLMLPCFKIFVCLQRDIA